MATDQTNNKAPERPQATSTSTYFRNIGIATRTLLHGLRLTWRHFVQAHESRKPIGVEDKDYFEQQTGIFTLQYPKQSLPVPDNGRYRLHNEIEDCIVCDKCAKVCPVDCIEIEPIKAVETFGHTSDGTPKRLYAAKFDIDMAKCCFCGLCTTVCPTECLTMTKVYDFSEYDVADHTYAFSEMTPLEILQKRKEQEEQQALKEAQKASRPAAARPAPAKPAAARSGMAKPAMPKPAASKPDQLAEGVQETARRLMEQKKAVEAAPAESAATEVPNPTVKSAPTPEGTENSPAPAAEKPKFRPRVVVKPKLSSGGEGKENTAAGEASPTSPAEAPKAASSAPSASKPRPVMKPVVKKAMPAESAAAEGPAREEPATETPKPKAAPRPVMKPVIKKVGSADREVSAEEPKPLAPQAGTPSPATSKPRPVVKPIIRKSETPAPAEQEKTNPAPQERALSEEESKKKPRPVIKPVISKRPMQAEDKPDQNAADEQSIKQSKPVVEKKVVVRKPDHEDETADDKRQEDSQRPKPPGRPD